MKSTMMSSRDIQVRLRIFRRTLLCLMDKVITAEDDESVPPEVTYQINQTRRELARLERTLADLQGARSIA